MSRLAGIKNEVRALLHGRCFLRRDREARALFLTDYPLHNEEWDTAKNALLAAAFTVSEENGLWRIDLGVERQARLIQEIGVLSLPADAPLEIASLCRSVEGRAQKEQAWSMIRQTLLWLDEGKDKQLLSMLRAQIAVCKRTHAPLPTAATQLIIEEILTGREIKC